MSAHSLLGGFATPSSWSRLTSLSASQVDALRVVEVVPEDEIVFGEPDRKLLAALSVDGRMTLADLTHATGWSDATVRKRLQQLRAAGILAYELDIDPRHLGYMAEARLWMSVQPSELAKVANELCTHPEIHFVAATTGPTNLVAAVACLDSAGLFEYLTTRISSLPAIRDLETAPVMKTVKRAGALPA